MNGMLCGEMTAWNAVWGDDYVWVDDKHKRDGDWDLGCDWGLWAQERNQTDGEQATREQLLYDLHLERIKMLQRIFFGQRCTRSIYVQHKQQCHGGNGLVIGLLLARD